MENNIGKLGEVGADGVYERCGDMGGNTVQWRGWGWVDWGVCGGKWG